MARFLRLLVAAGALSLAGCGFFSPRIEQPQFSVSAAPPVQPAKEFRNGNPDLNDLQAKAYCADGYEKVAASQAPTDDSMLDVWQVRCARYGFSLF